MGSKRKFPVSNVGTVSLIMVFIVLCMTIFALLSLTEANRDMSYSQKLAEHNTEYYRASNVCWEQIAEIDKLIVEINTDEDNALDFPKDMSFDKIEGVVAGPADTVMAENANRELTFANGQLVFCVPVNEKQAIEVVLELAKDGKSTVVKGFSEKATVPWEGDTTLHLYQGE